MAAKLAIFHKPKGFCELFVDFPWLLTLLRLNHRLEGKQKYKLCYGKVYLYGIDVPKIDDG